MFGWFRRTPKRVPLITEDGVRIVCPYVPSKLLQETKDALAPFHHELVDVSHHYDDYYQMLAALWKDGQSFLVVEHDMQPTAAQIEAIITCDAKDEAGEPYGWCASPYWVLNGDIVDIGLGFTKFSAELLQRFPTVMEEVGRLNNLDAPPKVWHRMDVRIKWVLKRLSQHPHRHDQVLHLNAGVRWRTDGYKREDFSGRYRWTGPRATKILELNLVVQPGQDFDWPAPIVHPYVMPLPALAER